MLAFLTILVNCIIITFLCLWKWGKTHYWNYIIMSKLPGPPSNNRVIGNIAYFHTSPEEIFQRLRECSRKYYPIYDIFSMYKHTANIIIPEDCEMIMSNTTHNEKGLVYKLLHKWLKFGLLTSRGTKWQIRRKILTPAFHFNILQEFIVIFKEEADKIVQILKEECKNESCINVHPLFAQFTLKTIVETAMGTKLDFNTKQHMDYKEAVYKIGKILLYKITHPWCIEPIGNFLNPLYFEEHRVTKILHKFTKTMIEEREKNFNDSDLPKEEHDVYKGKKRLAMLDLLLSVKKNEKIIDTKGIQEEVDTFTFEGHDTTASALSFALMLIACHKKSQNLIIDEMKDVLGDLHKKPTYVDLQNLKYLERCIKESLRLYPSVHYISRTLGEDLQTHSGYLLPKNTTATIHIFDVHRNPLIYPDPEKFDPDRFLPENMQNRHPYAYLAFSAGPRNCIGQKFAMLELKVAISTILANFVLEPVDTPETIVLVVDIVLRTKQGIKVKFIPREP